MHLTGAHVLRTNTGPLQSLEHACSTSYVMGATSKKIRLRQANMKFNKQNAGRISLRVFTCMLWPVCVSIHHVHGNILIITGNIY